MGGAPVQCSRALMDWQGENMWMLASNPTGPSVGEMRRVAMDGTGAESIDSLASAHHDFAVLPGGVIAALVYTGDKSSSSDVIERAPDGTVKTVIRLDSKVYRTTTNTNFHANALRYQAAGDFYTAGDRDAQVIVELTRAGQLSWQFGLSCTGAPAPRCAAAGWPGTVHGHQLLDSGDLLVFNNASMSTVYQFGLTVGPTALSAQQVWSYTGGSAANTPLGSMVLGDVQRLPNGNTLITYSTSGVIEEVTPSGDVVQTIAANSFGYTSFRETLYGPPAPPGP